MSNALAIFLLGATLVIISACVSDTRTLSAVPFGETKLSANPELHATQVQASDLDIAYAYLAQRFAAQGADMRRKWLVTHFQEDPSGQRHLRFRQLERGVPVWAGEAIVHIGKDDIVYSISDSSVPHTDQVNIIPSIDVTTAKEAAAATKAIGRATDAELTVLSLNGSASLAYRVTVTSGLMRDFVFVDAHHGSVLKTISRSPSNR